MACSPSLSFNHDACLPCPAQAGKDVGVSAHPAAARSLVWRYAVLLDIRAAIAARVVLTRTGNPLDLIADITDAPKAAFPDTS